MGYRTFARIPDQFLSGDDRFVVKTSITWFARLLDKGIPLTDEAFNFCLLALNDRATLFIEECREHIALFGSKRMRPDALARSLESFDDERNNYPRLASILEEAVNKCGTPLARPLTEAMRTSLAARLTDFKKGTGSNIERGIKTLKTFFRLNEIEASVLTAVYLLENWETLNDYFDSHLSCREPGKSKLLSILLDIPQQEFHKAISGKLSKLELLDTNRTLTVDRLIESIFAAPSENFDNLFYKELQKDILPLEYYTLDEGVTEHILSLLRTEGSTPTHILLYGEPGAGKTSFAATAAKAIGQQAFCVTTPGDSDSCARKKSLEACLNMTGNGKDGLVIVDEADNLLNTEFSFLFSGERQDKGWLNEFLERPGTRTIWITNETYGIPDSVMRRFAYSVKFERLDREQRVNIWNRIAAKNKVLGLVAPDLIKRFAVRYPLSAGSIDLAVKKAKEIAGRKKTAYIQALEKSLEASQQLIHGGSSLNKDEMIEREYSLDGLNLDVKVSALMSQLDAFNTYLDDDKAELRVNMNLLFYGPPGTGKTEMSRYLSRHLKRELIVKRTSDLLSKWVGESEQQIAGAFRQAEKQRAVLVIDEADSLLFSRDKAQRSWETSIVNEFLTQMEHFRGLLICTTNRMEELDSASLRRFNHKIRFDYLTSEGNLRFYERMLCPLAAKRATAEALEPLLHIRNLTPGDFKIVRDRYAFYPKSEVRHQDLVQGLKGESNLKEGIGKQRTIGF